MLDEYQNLIKATLTLVQEETYVLGDLPAVPAQKKVEKKEPPPVKAIPKKLVQTATPITLSKKKEPKVEAYQDIRSVIKDLAPGLYLHEGPPSDEKATQVKHAWKSQMDIPKIPLLVNRQVGTYLPFLQEIAKAIERYFGSSKLIDLDLATKDVTSFLQTPDMQCVILPDMLLWTSPPLLTQYKETRGNATKFLGEVPVILLPDLSLYKKDPLLKRSLWNVLCKMLS